MVGSKLPSDFLEFIENLKIKYSEERLYPVNLLIFGSYAKGNAHEHSDFDLCILVSDTDTNDFSEYSNLARLIASKMGLDVDVICMAQSDVTQHTLSPLGYEIWKHNVVV